MARYFELSAAPADLAQELGRGGERVAAMLRGLTEPRGTPPAGVRVMTRVPADFLNRVDRGWLAELERRRTRARKHLVESGRENELELAGHVAMLVATPRLEPVDADSRAISGAILWLLGTLVATCLADDGDPFLADLIASGWWPIGPVDGSFLIAPLTLATGATGGRDA